MNKTNWQPSASIETLRARANVLHEIRQFFHHKNVLEVETPVLSRHTVTDPHLHSLSADYPLTKEKFYFQTSPEYHMKRLLCAGSDSIFQLCKSFRLDEHGRIHNPEFTMLEWYRINFNHHQLMDEIEELLSVILNIKPAERYSYQAIFQKYLQCDPFATNVETLKTLAHQHDLNSPDLGDDLDAWLMFLFSFIIEPQLITATFIVDFPITQAALAKKNENDPRIGDRFELYINGMEIANGFYELSNAKEQRTRFETDLAKRKQLGYEPIEIDERFLAALEHGLPDCSGVALGVDRLVMLALNKQTIDEVLSFSFEKA